MGKKGKIVLDLAHEKIEKALSCNKNANVDNFKEVINLIPIFMRISSHDVSTSQ